MRPGELVAPCPPAAPAAAPPGPRPWLALALAALLLVLLGAAPPVSAHAFLASAQPAPGSLVVHPPSAVVLRYTEDVDPRLSSFAVYNARRDTVSGRAVVAGRTVTVPLETLPPGTYTLRWSVVSADDGHHTAGSFLFSVWRGGALPAGTGRTAQGGGGGVQGGWAGAAARTAAFLFTFALVGGTFLRLCLRTPPARRPAVLLAAGALLADAAAFLALGTSATGVGAARFLTGGYAVAALAAPFGRLAVLQAVGAVGTGLGLAVRGPWGSAAAASGSLALVVGLALGGHPAASARPLLGAVIDTLHVAAAAAWLGAVGWLAAWGRVGARLVARFSPWALGLVVAVAATGVGNALLTVHAFAALAQTLYGHVLDIKLALFAGVLAAAALSRNAARRALPGAARRPMAVEAGLGVLVLGAAAVLSASPPPLVFPPARVYVQASRRAGPLAVQLTLSPAGAGPNRITVRLTPARGQPAVAGAVSVEAQNLDMRMPAVRVPLPARGGGVYAASTGALSMAGTWRLTVAAGGVRVPFTVTVSPPGGGGACDYGFDPSLHAQVFNLSALATQVSPDPAAAGTVLVGTARGLWLTRDDGATWQSPLPLQGRSIVAAVIAPGGHTWYVATAGAMWVSTDAGASWAQAALPPGQTVETLLASPWTPGTLWLATPGGLWRSGDRGRRWRLESTAPAVRFVSRLAADPGRPGRLFAGANGGLLRSEDGGQTWQVVAPGAAAAFGFAFPAGRPGTVWASAMAQGFWVSRDGGQTWRESDSGVTSPGGMGIASWNGGRMLLAGTMGGGLAESTDGGATWTSAGCPASIVDDVVAQAGGPAGTEIWVGQDRGVVLLRPAA